jgi:choline dehydrogenase-like flavoprotein
VAEALSAPGGELYPLQDAESGPALFHEAGTCAMGGEDQPCDETGRLRAADTIWLADASVFPSAGDRHPTLTLLAHTLRVARSMVRHLRTG